MENDKLKNFPVIVSGYFKKHTTLIIKCETFVETEAVIIKVLKNWCSSNILEIEENCLWKCLSF